MMSIQQPSHKFLLLFSYIGTKYSGMQRQTRRDLKPIEVGQNENSIQYWIEQALENLNPKPSQEVKLQISSRTDAGVHAFENSGSVYLKHPIDGHTYAPSHIINWANDYLRDNDQEIKLNRVHLVDPAFDIQRLIKWRSYYYRFAVVKSDRVTRIPLQLESYLPILELNRTGLARVAGNLNLQSMKQAAELFQGTHDFSNFAAFSRTLQFRKPDYFQRTIEEITVSQCDLEPYEALDPSYRNIELYEVHIRSKAFLYKQIRRMVGVIMMIGYGNLTVNHLQSMLDSPEKVKWSPRMTLAPPNGLYLKTIKYDPKEFLNPPKKTEDTFDIAKEEVDEDEDDFDNEEDDNQETEINNLDDNDDRQ